MWWIVSGAILVGILYFVLITVFFIGWRRLNAFVPKGNEQIHTGLSVVVACRNEENHIRQLIGCLAQQSYQNFELILVDDHSEDATRYHIETSQKVFPKIRLVEAVGFGKKNAIKEGILISTNDLIVTTDADCLPSYHWLESIASFNRRYPSDLIICPVKLSWRKGLFSQLQILEFITLIASAAGSAGSGMPVLCNGANLAFNRKSWLRSQEDLHKEQMSGDDMFLLESIKERGGVIRFLKSESAFVTTAQAKTLWKFIKQRRRWASKSPAYSDWQIILTACIVFLVNLLLVILAGLSFINSTAIIVFLSLFTFKYLIDIVFLYSVRKFFQLNNIWFYSLFLSMFYPLYIVLVPLSTLVLKPTSWK